MKWTTLRKLSIALVVVTMLLLTAASVSAWPLFPDNNPVTAQVPVIMYHVITTNSGEIGKWGITPKELEADLLYLKNNGYTTVLVEDLIKFVDGKLTLPERPIMLTFDDGRTSDYTYLLPLLKTYEMKAVLSIVGTFADKYSGTECLKKPHMGWEQISELSKSGLVEIQCHSFNLHGKTGSGKLKGESLETYQARLKADLLKNRALILEHTGKKPTSFAYPLGIISQGSQEVLQEIDLQASFTCTHANNTITQGQPEGLFMLNRFNRPSEVCVGSILSKLGEKSPQIL